MRIILPLLFLALTVGGVCGDIFVLPIEGMIDLGISAFVSRTVSDAEAQNASSIIVKIDTFGGRVDAAVEIRDALVSSSVPTIAYIDQRAISAGALIALSCNKIYMTEGATIGAAQPVQMGVGGETQPTGEKEISYLRAEFKTTAEKNGHPALLAEAMVDPDVEIKLVEVDGKSRILSGEEATRLTEQNPSARIIKTVIAKGKLLTLSTEDALKLNLAQGTASTLEELLQKLNLSGNLRVARPTWSEHLVRFLTNPVVTSLLLIIGIIGIYTELHVPGFGAPGIVGLVCLGLFFGARYLVGLANLTDLMIFLLGVALLAVEIFLIPGFGATGAMGIILMLFGLYMALVRRPIPRFSWELDVFYQALYILAGTIIASLVLAVILAKVLPQTKLFSRIALVAQERAEEGYEVKLPELASLLNKEGIAITPLRPAGKARIGDSLIDVISDGEFIERNERIRVARIEGNRVIVEKVREEGK